MRPDAERRGSTEPALMSSLERRSSMSDPSFGRPGAPGAPPTVLGQCPVCAHELTVTRLQCRHCGTAVEGQFALGRFARLKGEQLAFLEVFVNNRGIIKDVEAELGISYPTVRARLDDVIKGLGFPTGGDDDPRPSPRQIQAQAREERRRILEELREKRITADEAARQLAGHAER